MEALAVLALDGEDAAVLITVVLVVVVVLGVAVAGFGTESVADPAPRCSKAGPAPPLPLACKPSERAVGGHGARHRATVRTIRTACPTCPLLLY